ncbi:MAG: hypothetical protein IJL25_08810, partial [Clostridia bacterium]|nr:hypothetical protein [Clostridia bacterium]
QNFRSSSKPYFALRTANSERRTAVGRQPDKFQFTNRFSTHPFQTNLIKTRNNIDDAMSLLYN